MTERVARPNQANVSRIEHEEDLYLSTLRAYVAALSGELELRAVFPERTVTLAAGDLVCPPNRDE